VQENQEVSQNQNQNQNQRAKAKEATVLKNQRVEVEVKITRNRQQQLTKKSKKRRFIIPNTMPLQRNIIQQRNQPRNQELEEVKARARAKENQAAEATALKSMRHTMLIIKETIKLIQRDHLEIIEEVRINLI